MRSRWDRLAQETEEGRLNNASVESSCLSQAGHAILLQQGCTAEN